MAYIGRKLGRGPGRMKIASNRMWDRNNDERSCVSIISMAFSSETSLHERWITLTLTHYFYITSSRWRFWSSKAVHSEFLIRITHPPLNDLHLNMPVYLATHCYHLPSLFHCLTRSSKPTFSVNLILYLSLFLSVGLISYGSRPFTGFICSSVLRFSSIFLF